MLKEICVIGHPSRLGGADTELDHQIKCWAYMGITTHICPTYNLDDNARAMKMHERGCVYHNPRDWQSIKGMHCISFCNGDFLDNLPKIKEYARTATFVNCMTWNFPKEIDHTMDGLIDLHLYQSPITMRVVSEQLKAFHTYKGMLFTPYFDSSEFQFHQPRRDSFRFGRISRPAPDKFNSKQLWIYESMVAPRPKQGLIVGWSNDIEKKIGRPPEWVGIVPPASITQHAFYEFCDYLIMSTDTTENLPRVGLEAMASGSLLIVDNRGGWPLLVDHGRTGWLCADEREFVYHASRAAYEWDESNEMRMAARNKLNSWGIEAASKSWESVFTTIENIR